MSARPNPNGPPQSSNGGHTKRVPILALSIEEACEALGVSWKTWHEMIEPEVKLVRLGRRKLVPVAELERWLADHAENVLERR
jgi:excisionase family DNA binding protein